MRMNLMNLNDRNWKAFKLQDICDIDSGKDIYENERRVGDIPYITSTSLNNGINYYVSNINESIDRNAISVNRNGSVGYAFYHRYKALYSNDCRKLKLKSNNNEYVSLFIANQIMQQKEKYNYGYKMGTGRLQKQYILLPVNNNNEPDWLFMKKYVFEHIKIKTTNYYNFIKSIFEDIAYREIEPLNSKQWSEFFLTEIFPEIQRGKRLTKTNQITGRTPYISSTAQSNGIDNYILNSKNVRLFRNCLTIANSGSVGASFYHCYEFVASDHVTHLKNHNFNKYQYLFITNMTNRFGTKYNFNREINDKRIRREKIMLPINSKAEPDYEYMEQFIKNMMIKKYKKYLNTDRLRTSCAPAEEGAGDLF